MLLVVEEMKNIKLNKKIVKRIAIVIVLIFVGLPLIYLGAVFGFSKIQLNSDYVNKKSKNQPIEIYLKNNGVHTDFIFPVKSKYKDWCNEFAIENTIAKDQGSNYIQVGWGDKGFYFNVSDWDSLTFKDVYTAAFALNESALHVTFLRNINTSKKKDRECVRLFITPNQYKELIKYVEETIERDSKNKSIHIDKISSYGPRDSFYEANGRYSLFHSCNTWVNVGLKKADLPATFWTVMSGPILECY